MRKIIVYIVTGADDYIARPGASIDRRHRPEWAGGDDLRADMRSIDAVIRGRETYDQVRAFTGRRASAGFGGNVRHYVCSTKPPAAIDGVDWVDPPVESPAQRLRVAHGKDIRIAPRHHGVQLRLKSSRKFSDGVARLHYEVVGHDRRLGAKAAGKRSGRARTKASSRAHRRGSRR